MEQKKHILIADIDGDLLTRLAIFFEDKGYDTTTAWGGREALEQLYSGKFEVVLLSDYTSAHN
jgi:DNA-binding response OmpR family regulator